MKSFVVLCLVLSLVIGRSTATASASGVAVRSVNCYAWCSFICLTSPVECALCVERCTLTSDSSQMASNDRNTQSFCKLGCATSLCTKFLTNGRPDEKKVHGCVNSCDETCTNT